MTLVNTTTKKLINAYTENPTGTLLLVGDNDTGISKIVDDLIIDLLGRQEKNNLIEVSPEEGKKIGISQIRELNKSFQTMVKTTHRSGRVGVINDADFMTREAQNALLKMIEEPILYTNIILKSPEGSNLLPTIRSRCKTINILPITKEQAKEYAKKQNVDKSVFDKAFLLSKGHADAFVSLILNNQSQLQNQIDDAKDFLMMTVFERISLQKKYSTVEVLDDLITSIDRIAEAAMHSVSQSNVNKWSKILQASRRCRLLLKTNVNTKLVFLRLCTQL